MATTNNPYDMSEFMKAFDPERMMRMWSPQSMMRMFQQPATGSMFDMDEVIRTNQRNFEAMAEANRSAAAAYKDLLDRQLAIFNQVTDAAQKQYAENAGPDQIKERQQKVSSAVEEALKLMQMMAEKAREANEEAYKNMQSQVERSLQMFEENSQRVQERMEEIAERTQSQMDEMAAKTKAQMDENARKVEDATKKATGKK